MSILIRKIQDFKTLIKANDIENLTKSIIICNTFEGFINIGTIPDFIEEISFRKRINLKPGILPKNLKILGLAFWDDNEMVVGVLPDSLEILDLRDCYFNGPVIREGVLPNNLKKLYLSRFYDSLFVKNVLPPSLKKIRLGFSYNQPFESNILPNTLEKLSLGFNFYQKLGCHNLPDSLRIIHVFIQHKGSNIAYHSILEYLRDTDFEEIETYRGHDFTIIKFIIKRNDVIEIEI